MEKLIFFVLLIANVHAHAQLGSQPKETDPAAIEKVRFPIVKDTVKAGDSTTVNRTLDFDKLREILLSRFEQFRDSIIDAHDPDAPVFSSVDQSNIATLLSRPVVNPDSFYKKSEAVVFDTRVYRMKAIRALQSKTVAETFGTQVVSNTVSTYSLNDGQALLSYVYLEEPDTLTGIQFILRTVGTFTSDNFNGGVLYKIDPATGNLTLVAQSANDATFYTGTTGVRNMPFTSTYIAPAGPYYIGYVYNAASGGTAPVVHGGGAASGDYHNLWDFPNSIKIAMYKTMNVATPTTTFTAASCTTISDRLAGALYK